MKNEKLTNAIQKLNCAGSVGIGTIVLSRCCTTHGVPCFSCSRNSWQIPISSSFERPRVVVVGGDGSVVDVDVDVDGVEVDGKVEVDGSVEVDGIVEVDSVVEVDDGVVEIKVDDNVVGVDIGTDVVNVEASETGKPIG